MEKRKFIIPSAAEVKSADNTKPKVKSYFKARNNTANNANDGLTSACESSTKASTKHLQSTAGDHGVIKDKSLNGKMVAPSTESKTGRLDAESTVSSVPSTSTTVVPQEIQKSNVAATGNKIGSGFADKFAALKETAKYEKPKMPEHSAAKAPDVPVVKSKAISYNCLVVHPKQRGNPILKFVRNVPYEFNDIVPDYIMGKTTCALFLSLRYHLLNPNYIFGRAKSLSNMFNLRLLLVQVDIKDPGHPLKALAKMAILADFTLLLAWSAEEAGRYLETYKTYENKSADTLKERVQADFMSKMTDCLTTIKSINKTDAATLLTTFDNFEGIVKASEDELGFCPGFGPNKAKRVARALKEPFMKKKSMKVKEDIPKTEDIPGTSKS
ncbi:DNA excision repair protein ERCC-1-like [Antedon mediterranea]|uniref:DNA excision repair protein ERCC-1-like n=1 Tax=Antedon mediterranea TaxID=105859 RepID=UPI003AF97741